MMPIIIFMGSIIASVWIGVMVFQIYKHWGQHIICRIFGHNWTESLLARAWDGTDHILHRCARCRKIIVPDTEYRWERL